MGIGGCPHSENSPKTELHRPKLGLSAQLKPNLEYDTRSNPSVLSLRRQFPTVSKHSYTITYNLSVGCVSFSHSPSRGTASRCLIKSSATTVIPVLQPYHPRNQTFNNCFSHQESQSNSVLGVYAKNLSCALRPSESSDLGHNRNCTVRPSETSDLGHNI